MSVPVISAMVQALDALIRSEGEIDSPVHLMVQTIDRQVAFLAAEMVLDQGNLLHKNEELKKENTRLEEAVDILNRASVDSNEYMKVLQNTIEDSEANGWKDNDLLVEQKHTINLLQTREADLLAENLNLKHEVKDLQIELEELSKDNNIHVQALLITQDIRDEWQKTALEESSKVIQQDAMIHSLETSNSIWRSRAFAAEDKVADLQRKD